MKFTTAAAFSSLLVGASAFAPVSTPAASTSALNLAVGETATDTFKYTVADSKGATNTATVTITINGANDANTANDDSGVGFVTDEDSSFTTNNVRSGTTTAAMVMMIHIGLLAGVRDRLLMDWDWVRT